MMIPQSLRVLTVTFFASIPFGVAANDVEAEHRLSFKCISVNEGLSHNSVTSFVQNRNGGMLISTYDGMNFYDGYNITAMRHSSDNPDGLFNNRIVCMRKHSDGTIWLGMDGGLARYNCDRETFHNYIDHLGKLRSYWIRSICSDCAGNLWIGTLEDLVFGELTSEGEFRFYPVSGFPPYAVYSIRCDQDGKMLVGTSNGLYVFDDPTDDRLIYKEVSYFHGRNVLSVFNDSEGNLLVGTSDGVEIRFHGEEQFGKIPLPSLSQVPVQCFLQDKEGYVWIGTLGEGLYRIQLDNRTLSDMSHYSTGDILGRLTDDNIQALYLDPSNVLWVGTRNGVNYADISRPGLYIFKPIVTRANNQSGYTAGHINTLFADGSENLWISIYGNGLYRYDLKRKDLVDMSKQITRNQVSRIIKSSDGSLWFAAQESVYRVSVRGGKYLATKVDLGVNPNEALKFFKFYTDICEDSFGRIWVATIRGLILYEPQKKQYRVFTMDDGLSSDSPFCLCPDRDSDEIWVGSSDHGITRIKYDTSGIISTQIIRKKGTPFAINHDQVWCIREGRDGNMWVGTDGGLNMVELDAAGEIISTRRIAAPYIKDAKIEAITEDHRGNLWLNGSQGLYCYNAADHSVRCYTNEDGLQSNACTSAAATIGDWIFIGGINGINYFNPGVMHNNTYAGMPVITRLKVFNTTLHPLREHWGRVLLSKGLNETPRVPLSSRQNNFTIEFTSDNYAAPGKNMYRYMLHGYDQGWISTGSDKRYASYENLPAGKYLFQVACSNNDGQWSEVLREIAFVIAPPFWRTWWAYSLYTIFVFGVVIAVFLYISSRHKWRRELFIREMDKDKNEKINEMKLNFYTNITHELRTPLSLISAPLGDLLKKFKDDEYTVFRLSLIEKNRNKLLKLINELLDIRRVSANSMPMSVEEHYVYNLVKQSVDSFQQLSLQTGIYLRIIPPEDNVKGWLDGGKLDKILKNLISNAFKFTPEKGSIEVRVSSRDEGSQRFVFISVEDSGIGISEEEFPKIFDMFYHGTPLTGQSSGIGLSFTKALVELHGGEITIDSRQGEGSVFTVRLRIDKEYYREEYIVETETVFEPVRPEPQQHTGEFTILIIEDNKDMMDYISRSLEKDFQLITAINGNDGVRAAQKLKPDLVITDMMMPGMDGLQLIRKLKSDSCSSHIPVIVHSVKSDRESIRSAFEEGAQEYIVKPFESENLIMRIRNQLKSRSSYAHKVRTEMFMEPSGVSIPSEKERLISRIKVIVEKNITDPSFGVDELSAYLNMSRTQLYRKLKTLSVGKNPVEIIRDIRIHRASQLLSTGQLRISEVMYEVGITNHNRFIRYFVEVFKMTPREYIAACKSA